jgi:hypothetical protein
MAGRNTDASDLVENQLSLQVFVDDFAEFLVGSTAYRIDQVRTAGVDQLRIPKTVLL